MGKIVPNGVRLQAHEYDTVLYFTEMGKEVELIKPLYTPGRRNNEENTTDVCYSEEW